MTSKHELPDGHKPVDQTGTAVTKSDLLQPQDDELQALLSVVQQKTQTAELVGKRDYALLLLFIATGMRRAEVLYQAIASGR